MKRDWFLIGFGVLALLAGVGLGGWSAWAVATYERATGSVRFEQFGRRGTTQYKVSFPTAGGGSATIDESAISWLGMGYEDGAKVPILYPKSAPEWGTIATFWNLWLWPIVLGLGGAFFVATSFWTPAEEGEENLSAEQLLAREKRRRE